MNKWKVYGLMDLATKLMVINFIWFLTLLIGMFVFTIFPATAALFIVVKKQLEHSLAYSDITKLFFKYFKDNFIKFSLLGVIVSLFFLILASNFIFIINYGHIAMVSYVLRPIMIFIGIVGFMVLGNIFILNCYNEVDAKGLLEMSIKSALTMPFNAVKRFLVLLILSLIVFMMPGLLPLISMNVYAIACIWLFPKATNKLV